MCKMILKGNYEVDIDKDRVMRAGNLSDEQFDETMEFVENTPNTIFFLDTKLNSDVEPLCDTKYMWIDMGTCDGKFPRFISLLKNGDVYTGGWIGNAKDLGVKAGDHFKIKGREVKVQINRFNNLYIEKAQERSEAPNTSKTIDTILVEEDVPADEKADQQQENYKEPAQKNASVTDEIYDKLLINNWRSKKGLERYIKIIGRRAQQLLESKQEKYYIVSEIGSLVINTGLIDKYSNDILVVYRLHKRPEKHYEAYKIVDSKASLMEDRFRKEDVCKTIAPISMTDGDMYLSGVTKDDFDISLGSLVHMIEERAERIPEELRNLPSDVLARKMMEAFEMGIKILERDSTFAKPSYSGKRGSISWHLPLHINSSITEEPEIVMVIAKGEYFYEGKTILPYDDCARDRFRAMSLYHGCW